MSPARDKPPLKINRTVHHIDLDRYLDQLPVDLLPKDMGHLRVVNGDWNDLEAGGRRGC